MKENTILNKEGKQISRFWTDSAQLNNNGIPAINFGPGNPKLAHSDKEHINLVDLEEFYKKLVDFLN